MPGFNSGGSGACVAVHRVTLPYYTACVFAGFHGADMGREEGTDFGGAVAGYEGNFSDFDVRVQEAEEGKNVGGRGCWSDFYADRVGYASEVFDVCAVYLASSVPNPEKVRGGVVVGFSVVGDCVGAGFGSVT